MKVPSAIARMVVTACDRTARFVDDLEHRRDFFAHREADGAAAGSRVQVLDTLVEHEHSGPRENRLRDQHLHPLAR